MQNKKIVDSVDCSYLFKLVKGPAEGLSEVGHAVGFQSVNGLKKDLLVTIIRLDKRVETRHFVRIFGRRRVGMGGFGQEEGGKSIFGGEWG